MIRLCPDSLYLFEGNLFNISAELARFYPVPDLSRTFTNGFGRDASARPDNFQPGGSQCFRREHDVRSRHCSDLNQANAMLWKRQFMWNNSLDQKFRRAAPQKIKNNVITIGCFLFEGSPNAFIGLFQINN